MCFPFTMKNGRATNVELLHRWRPTGNWWQMLKSRWQEVRRCYSAAPSSFFLSSLALSPSFPRWPPPWTVFFSFSQPAGSSRIQSATRGRSLFSLRPRGGKITNKWGGQQPRKFPTTFCNCGPADENRIVSIFPFINWHNDTREGRNKQWAFHLDTRRMFSHQYLMTIDVIWSKKIVLDPLWHRRPRSPFYYSRAHSPSHQPNRKNWRFPASRRDHPSSFASN